MINYLDESEFKKQNKITINLSYIFIILFLLTTVCIYFYSGFELNYIKFLFPYFIIWQVSLILVGISMFKIKNIADLSIGLLFVIFSIALIHIIIINYQFNIKNDTQNKLLKINSLDKINANIDLSASTTSINVENFDELKFNYNSNYGISNFQSYVDDNKVNFIQLKQTSLPSGLGQYKKNNELLIPRFNEIILNTKYNLSNVKTDLTNMKLISSNIELSNSKLDLIINDLDINGEAFLNIKSIFSIAEIKVSKNIQIILIDSSKLSFNSFVGIEKYNLDAKEYKSAWIPTKYIDNNSESNIYKTKKIEINNELNNEIKTDPENYIKTLIINLDSTLSSIKIYQQ